MPPPLTNYTYAFGDGGFILNQDFNGTLPFVDVESITGLDGAPIRVNSSEHQGQDGGYIDAQFMSARTIVITGTLYADPNDPDSICMRLKGEYGPVDPSGGSGVHRFFYQHPGQALKFINAVGGGCQYSIDTLRRVGQTAIQLTLLCADPYIYDHAQGQADTQPLAGRLNANADFESGTTPWTPNNNSILASSSLSFAGSFSMQMNGNGSTATPGAISELIPVVANGKYTVNAQAFTIAAYASGVQVAIKWFTSGLGLISTSTGSATPTSASTWTSVSLGSTSAPGTAAFAQVVLQAVGTPGAGTAFFWDSAIFASNIGHGFPQGFPSGVNGFGGPITTAFSNAVVYNNGNHTAYPIFTLKGVLLNPITITNALTSRQMQFNLFLNLSDTLVVDCGHKSVLLNGQSQRNSLLGLFWFSLGPGLNDTYYIRHGSGIQPSSSGKFHVDLYSTFY
jgi:hypothetical protein